MKRCKNHLPWGPVDQIGPRMRPGLAQTGTFGQILIVRNNPIGALFDQVRAYCSPLDQSQVGEDSYVAEDAAASTPEYTSFDYGAPLDSGWFAANTPFGPPGPQTIDNAPSPTPTPTADPAGLEQASSARAALATAIRARDCEGVRRVLDQARQARGGSQKSPQFLRWQPIAAQAKAWLTANRKACGPV